MLFVVYALGASRTIYVGDSGELAAAAALPGIPHPSGYPLYVLAGKLWTLLVPAGSIAARLSLFSAAAAAGACGLLFLLCRRMAFGALGALFAAALLAFSPSFWREANIQRTYALNALFLALAALLLLRFLESRTDTRLAALFFCCGLGACNHLFMAVAAACAAFVIALRPARFVVPLAAFAAGLSPYLYLPLRSRFDPPLDWGNPETPGALLDVVLRRGFWEKAWVTGPSDLATVAGDYLLSLGAETAWAGGALAIVGGVTLFRRNRPLLGFALLVMTANLVILAAHGSREDIFLWHRYYIPSYVMMALLAGAGCHALSARLPAIARPALLAVPLFLLISGWSMADRSRYRIADHFARSLLEALPPGSHLMASDDNVLFPLMYLHLVEKVRPDVHLVMQGVGAGPPPLHFNPDSEPLFATHHPNWTLPLLAIEPVGPAFAVVRAGGPPPPPLPFPEKLDGEDDPRVPKDELTRHLIGHFHYMRGVTLESGDWNAARREFALAADTAHDNDVLFHNLGLIYERNGLTDEAAAAFARSRAINPRQRRAGP